MRHAKFLVTLFAAALLLAAGPAFALTAGETYTITVDAIGSDGQVVNLSFSDTDTADGDGKIAFSFTGLPTSEDYNFLLVTIKDSGGTTVRRTLAPAAAAGETTNLGASPMTEAQTAALLQAMEVAESDDPVMALFGFIIVRSGSLDDESIVHIGHMARLAIVEGFNVYLEEQIGATKMAAFKAAVQSHLGSYSALIKDAVDAASDDDEKNQRAAAAAMLSEILMEAAAEAGFDLGLINVAMDSAGEQAEAYLAGDGSTLDPTVMSGINAVMSATHNKLKAERVRQKYTLALTTLGASDSQVTRLNEAVTNLAAAMSAVWQDFEELFAQQDAGGEVDAADFEAAMAAQQAACNTAFSTFMSESASTNAEIDDLVEAMSEGFDIPLDDLNDMKDPDDDGVYGEAPPQPCGMFTFWDNQQNIVNWPITMVVAFTWVAENHPDDFTYTRDDTAIPEDLCSWMDSDHDPTNGVIVGRTDFESFGMPAALAGLFGLREDLEIIQQRKWAAETASSWDLELDAYGAMDAGDQAEAEGHEADDAARFDIAEGADTDDDWADGVDQPNWERANDMPPYVTTAERQTNENTYVTAIAARKDAMGPAGISDDVRQALIDTATMPSF